MNLVILSNIAISNLRPNAKYFLYGEGYSGIEWLDKEQTKPTEEEFNIELAKVQEEFKPQVPLKEYQRKRASEYPPIGDQLDALFHAGLMPPELAIKIQAVKAKYPKV